MLFLRSHLIHLIFPIVNTTPHMATKALLSYRNNWAIEHINRTTGESKIFEIKVRRVYKTVFRAVSLVIYWYDLFIFSIFPSTSSIPRIFAGFLNFHIQIRQISEISINNSLFRSNNSEKLLKALLCVRGIKKSSDNFLLEKRGKVWKSKSLYSPSQQIVFNNEFFISASKIERITVLIWLEILGALSELIPNLQL